jgi:hypothetical protein
MYPGNADGRILSLTFFEKLLSDRKNVETKTFSYTGYEPQPRYGVQMARLESNLFFAGGVQFENNRSVVPVDTVTMFTTSEFLFFFFPFQCCTVFHSLIDVRFSS